MYKKIIPTYMHTHTCTHMHKKDYWASPYQLRTAEPWVLAIDSNSYLCCSLICYHLRTICRAAIPLGRSWGSVVGACWLCAA